MLYPEIEPFDTGTLQVSDGHTLYFEQTGNVKGYPVLFLHGGPGAGLPKGYQRFFDPNQYHIIGFDQRGCGRSEPHCDIGNNTSDHLLQDIQSLKSHLGIEKWILFGGSWGATLALLAAIDSPESIIAIVLRGTFLGRNTDIDWFLAADGGAANLFPDMYDMFIKPVHSVANGMSICNEYMDLFTGDDEIKRAAAIRSWFQWEEKLSRLSMPSNYSSALNAPLKDMTSMAVLECHYLANRCFIEENFILNNIDKIEHIPGIIVHGRYDSICSVKGAYLLHQAWSNSELNIVPSAGHSTAEPGICNALSQATRQVARFLRHT